MNCALNKNQQLQFYRKVSGDIQDNIKAGQKFDFDSYARGLYDIVNKSQDDPVLALSYVQMLHQYIGQSKHGIILRLINYVI